MPKKVSIDLNIVVPILVGVIVLLGVYIIVNKKENHVSFSFPEVTEIYQPPVYYDPPVIRSEPIFLQQPTFFNPNRHERDQVNMYNIQMKEGMTLPPMPDFSKMFQSGNQTATMPTMGGASQQVSMNIPSQPAAVPAPMDSASDSVGSL